jgi:hypothetical protein
MNDERIARWIDVPLSADIDEFFTSSGLSNTTKLVDRRLARVPLTPATNSRTPSGELLAVPTTATLPAAPNIAAPNIRLPATPIISLRVLASVLVQVLVPVLLVLVVPVLAPGLDSQHPSLQAAPGPLQAAPQLSPRLWRERRPSLHRAGRSSSSSVGSGCAKRVLRSLAIANRELALQPVTVRGAMPSFQSSRSQTLTCLLLQVTTLAVTGRRTCIA